MKGPREPSYGRIRRGELPPVGLLAAGLGLASGCSVFRGSAAANDGYGAIEDEPPPSGWRGLATCAPPDRLSQTGGWPG